MFGPGSRRKTFVYGAVLIAGTFVLWAVVWHLVGDRLLTGDDYRLSVGNLHTTPQPAWIRRDIRQEVLRGAGLDAGPSILEDDLPRRIYDAFRLHPWVEEVKQVVKRYPASVHVELVYRRPVCQVEVAGGIYMIDAHAVVLPAGDFAPNEAAQFPRLIGIQSSPQGGVGAAWGDDAVLGGARLAAMLQDAWRPLDLAAIVPRGSPTRADDDPSAAPTEYVLVTSGQSRIHWGTAPAERNDSAAAEKLTWLRQYVAENGPLDKHGAQVIDLRQKPYRPVPITATRPAP